MSPRHRPTDLPDVFVGSHAVAEGVLTAHQLRGPFVRRVIQGVYRPAWVPLTHRLKCRAACLVLPDAVLVTGVSAITCLGLRMVGREEEVHVVAPDVIVVARRSGIALRRCANGPVAGRLLDGVRLAHSYRIAFDAAARQPTDLATAHLDVMLRAGLVDRPGLELWLDRCHDNDVRDVREALGLADDRAESMPESRLRVHLRRAGLLVVPQYVVTSRGKIIARVDLAIPELRIAIEYDGRWHGAQEQLPRDAERDLRLVEAGWLVVHVNAAMLREPDRVVALVRAAMSRQAGSPA
jgi:very-short-patch-repair endonuclease